MQMQIYQTYLTCDPVINENINLYFLKKNNFRRTLFYIAGYLFYKRTDTNIYRFEITVILDMNVCRLIKAKEIS